MELIILTQIALILVIGFICSAISNKFKIFDHMLYLLAGLILAQLTYQGQPLFDIPDFMVNIFSIIAVSLIVLDSSSRFKVRDLGPTAKRGALLALVSTVTNFVILGLVTHIVFFDQTTPITIALSGLFSALISSSTMIELYSKKKRTSQVLITESIIANPLVLIFAFVCFDFANTQLLNPGFYLDIRMLGEFILQYPLSLGTGFMIGIVTFRFMRDKYSKRVSPIILMASAVLTYTATEMMHGDGILAVAFLGFFFGNIYLKEKKELQKQSITTIFLIEVFVFILLGLTLPLNLDPMFILSAFGLWVLYVFVRFIVVMIVLSLKGNSRFNFKNKLFATLYWPMGAVFAILNLFIYEHTEIPEIMIIMNIIVFWILFSNITANIMNLFRDKFF